MAVGLLEIDTSQNWFFSVTAAVFLALGLVRYCGAPAAYLSNKQSV